MVSEQEIADAVATALLGELYVGQRIRVKAIWGAKEAGMQTVITEIMPNNYVRIDPPLIADGVWDRSWFEPDYD